MRSFGRRWSSEAGRPSSSLMIAATARLSDSRFSKVRPRRACLRTPTPFSTAPLSVGVRGRTAWVRFQSACKTRRIHAGSRAPCFRGLPDPFPIAAWSEHRVRTDCHVQVRANFYLVPHTLVGKRVVIRMDSTTITAYDNFNVVARHERRIGRGKTVTDRMHYPEHKRKGSHEIHRERVDRIRSVGPGAAAFYAGLLTSSEYVHSDSYRALLCVIETTPATDVNRACARAAHFGNFSMNALRRIIEQRLYERHSTSFRSQPANRWPRRRQSAQSLYGPPRWLAMLDSEIA